MSQPVPDVQGDIAAFDAAIATISTELNGFATDVTQLRSHFAALVDDWTSPAALTVGDLQQDVLARIEQLHTLLDQMLVKIRHTRQSYMQVQDVNKMTVRA